MTRCSLLLLSVVLGLVACGDDDAPAPVDDAGPGDGAVVPDAARDSGPREDAGPQACTVPDMECPADQPFASAACDFDAMCTYPDPDGSTTWTYQCMDGHWMGTNDCMPPPGGVCPVGPLAEGCRTPFDGTTSATIEIGPTGAGAFRPFEPSEHITPIVGGQGAPMVTFRVRVTGDDVPACVALETQLTLDGGTPQTPTMRPLVLHCGESLAMFEIMGGDLCHPGPFSLEIHVTMQGVGEGTATVTFDEVPCTG